MSKASRDERVARRREQREQRRKAAEQRRLRRIRRSIIRRYYNKIQSRLRRKSKILAKRVKALEAIRLKTHGLNAFMSGFGLRIRTRETVNSIPSRIKAGVYSWFAPSFANHADWYVYPRPHGNAAISEFCEDEIHAGPPWEDGGPFKHFVRRDPYPSLVSNGTYYSSSRNYKYEGGFLLDMRPPINWDLAFSDREVDYTALGTTAWHRFKPGRPGADLGIFLGEIRDVPETLARTAKGFATAWKAIGGTKGAFGPRHVADHWLNTQFGWLPFVNDVRKFYKTYVNCERMLQQIRSQNGHWQRRGGTILRIREEDQVGGDTEHTAHSLCPSSYFYADPTKTGHYEIWRIKETHVWFRASFRYYIPDIESVKWSKMAVARLFGLEFTPSLLWELTPWSWLIDWFSNAGDVFANADNGLAENLTARYAYVMGETKYSYNVTSFHDIETSPISDSVTYVAKHQLRQAASPFGFGLSYSTLSGRQTSILAALGESRLKLLGNLR